MISYVYCNHTVSTIIILSNYFTISPCNPHYTTITRDEYLYHIATFLNSWTSRTSVLAMTIVDGIFAAQ